MPVHLRIAINRMVVRNGASPDEVTWTESDVAAYDKEKQGKDEDDISPLALPRDLKRNEGTDTSKEKRSPSPCCDQHNCKVMLRACTP